MALFNKKQTPQQNSLSDQPQGIAWHIGNAASRAATTVASAAKSGIAQANAAASNASAIRTAADYEARLAQQAALMSPEMQAVDALQEEASILNAEINRQKQEMANLAEQISTLHNSIKQKKAQLFDVDEQMMLDEVGLFKPQFDFANSTQYSERLKQCREQQKQLVKVGQAATAESNWTINGSVKEGKKLTSDISKLLLRAFNGECDDVVRKVKYSNLDASKDRIHKSAISINKLGKAMGIGITTSYVSLKQEELQLAFEFAVKKEAEKEALREAREQEREEARLRKEIEAARKKLQKEQSQYSKALLDAQKQLSTCSDEERPALQSKIDELTANLGEVEKGIADVDYREANQRAGYVYIISNIGSFGENVYKIGMTRRLDPMERVKELGDASVPFAFDVHALIFSKDAPGLEAALHQRFSDKKVNLINPRREFFRCTLDEIVQAVKDSYDQTVEFEMIPNAEQWRMSEKLREQASEGVCAN